MNSIEKEIQKELFKHQDKKYKEFIANLTPSITKEKFIGVRVPIIRKIAKQYAKEKNIENFLNNLPHKYIEEDNIHGLIISTFKDYDKTILYLDAFLPYVNNWATCDIIKPISFKKNKENLKTDILKWIKAKETYTIRFGIEAAMTHFLDEDFDVTLMNFISKIRSNEYYVNMMIAWYFATALAKQPETSIEYIKNYKLDKWTHNKTIQKARESYRISEEQKKYLNFLKIK